MFPSTGCRRLAALIRRSAAAAAGGTNPIQSQSQPQPHARFLRCYSSGALARTPNPDTASYLIASCGLSPAAAAALVARGISIRSTAKADAVLSLLRHHGFSDAHIAQLVRVAPRILLLDPDKIIRPKLEFFDSLGVRVATLARTNALLHSLDNRLVPWVDFIRDIVGTDAGIRTAINGNSFFFRFDIEKQMRPSVESLRHHGLSKEAISKLINEDMSVLSVAPYRIAIIFEDLEVLGLPITHYRFFKGFAVMCRINRETIWRRLALYQSFGLSQCQVAKAFRFQPSILELSDENIQRKLLFFREELNIALSLVIAHPKLLTFSVEKNILPKCAVLSVLLREQKIGRDINLVNCLKYSYKDFSERYMKKYEKDVPDVVRAYEGKIEFRGFMDKDNDISVKSQGVSYLV